MAQAPKMADIQNLLGNVSARSTEATQAPKLSGLVKSESAPSTTHIPAPPKTVAPKVELNPEGWLKFVAFIKQQNAFLAAKLDNIVFAGVTEKNITLQAAAQFSFLAEQMAQAETHSILQGFIDSFFGQGYTFNVVKAKVASGDTAKSMNQKIEQETEDKIASEILQDPRVQAAQRVFKAQAKVITNKE
jgi:DNA polymerase III subunit gamma/tau